MKNYKKTGFANCIAKGLALVSLLLGLSVPAAGQYDPAFTHYMFNEFFINPAYAGAKDALCIEGIMRQQWTGFPGRPKTYGLSAHTPVANDKVGLGLGMTYEEIGTKQLALGYLDFAYRVHLSRGIWSFGLQGNVGYQDPRYYRLENMTDPYLIDPLLYEAHKGAVFNAGFGTYYYTDNFYVGFSIPRLLNNLYVEGKNDRFDIKDWTYYLQGGYVFHLNEYLDLMPSAMLKITAGVSPQVNISVLALGWNTLWLGVDFRTDKTFAAMAGVQISKVFRVCYSYDFNLNSTERQWLGGSHEISLTYTFDFWNKRVVSPRLF